MVYISMFKQNSGMLMKILERFAKLCCQTHHTGRDTFCGQLIELETKYLSDNKWRVLHACSSITEFIKLVVSLFLQRVW